MTVKVVFYKDAIPTACEFDNEIGHFFEDIRDKAKDGTIKPEIVSMFYGIASSNDKDDLTAEPVGYEMSMVGNTTVLLSMITDLIAKIAEGADSPEKFCGLIYEASVKKARERSKTNPTTGAPALILPEKKRIIRG